MTYRQKRFIEYYLQTWNASAAARLAGYTGAADRTGERLLRNVEIQQAIKARMAEIAMDTDEVLRRLADQARLNPTEFITETKRPVYDNNGVLLFEIQTYEVNWEKLKERGHLVKGIVPTQYGLKLEFHDAQAALFKIGTALGALTERVDWTSKGDKLEVVFYLPDNNRHVSDDNSAEDSEAN